MRESVCMRVCVCVMGVKGEVPIGQLHSFLFSFFYIQVCVSVGVHGKKERRPVASSSTRKFGGAFNIRSQLSDTEVLLKCTSHPCQLYSHFLKNIWNYLDQLQLQHYPPGWPESGLVPIVQEENTFTHCGFFLPFPKCFGEKQNFKPRFKVQSKRRTNSKSTVQTHELNLWQPASRAVCTHSSDWQRVHRIILLKNLGGKSPCVCDIPHFFFKVG